MAGHSKWANIKHKKARTDAKRGASFTKLLRAVQVAAQSGADVELNPSLATAIENAKKGGVPKDTIERAVARGSGDDKDGVQMEEALYEGYGPAGVAVLVESVTDNKNRASSDIKHVFSKYGGSFGGSGSVQWMFDRKAVVQIFSDQLGDVSLDELQLSLMDAGAQEIEDDDGLMVSGEPEAYAQMMIVIKQMGLSPDFSGLMWVAKDGVDVEEAGQESLQKFLDALEELDDVAEVYTNVA